jgi:hypothetical protein
VIRAIGALYKPMMKLCNYLPEEAVQSPEAFFDCLNQIAATPNDEIDHPNQRGMQLSASVLRSGVYFLNHVGRSYFKYVVEYVLEQYRKIFRIGGGSELVPQAQKLIGYQ